MELNIKNRKALIIAGHGIGACLCKNLVHEGAVVCGVARSSVGLQELHRSIPAAGLLTYAINLLPEGAEEGLFSFLQEQKFSPDIVVHCMGGQPQPTKETAALWRSLYRSMFEIPLLINEECLPAMRAQGWGRIIHTGSAAALEAQGSVPYSPSKPCSRRIAVLQDVRRLPTVSL